MTLILTITLTNQQTNSILLTEPLINVGENINPLAEVKMLLILTLIAVGADDSVTRVPAAS